MQQMIDRRTEDFGSETTKRQVALTIHNTIEQCYSEIGNYENQVEKIGINLENCLQNKRSIALYNEKPIFSEAKHFECKLDLLTSEAFRNLVSIESPQNTDLIKVKFMKSTTEDQLMLLAVDYSQRGVMSIKNILVND